jgi:hypothetical protein
MENETVYAVIFAICKLLGQEKDYYAIEEAFNEGLKMYRKTLPPERA